MENGGALGALLNNQPHIHLISRGYFLGPNQSPFKGLGAQTAKRLSNLKGFPTSPMIDLVGGHHSFQFDQTFGHTASNKRVYKHAAAEIVQAACDGGVGTIFMFGQTGSGKTHTMLLGRKR